MKFLMAAVLFCVSSTVFASMPLLTCQTNDPMYDVTLTKSNHMTVQDEYGRRYTGIASYADNYATDMLYSYYLPLSFNSGFWLIIREGFLPNWTLCTSNKTCYRCDPTRD